MESDKIEKIRTLIAEDEIEQALQLLAEVYQESNFIREIIIQKRRYKALIKDNNQGVITYGEASLEKNKITKAILDLIKDIEQREQEVG